MLIKIDKKQIIANNIVTELSTVYPFRRYGLPNYTYLIINNSYRSNIHCAWELNKSKKITKYDIRYEI